MNIWNSSVDSQSPKPTLKLTTIHHTYTLYDRNKRNNHALQIMCVHGLHSNKGNLYTLKVSIFTFLRNIIILLHFYATHVIQVFVYLLSLQSKKLSYSAPSVYHYLCLNRKKIARTHTLFNSIYVQSACLSYTHMYHVHLHHVHFYSNNLLYYLSYTIFLNDNKIATCIYPKLKKKKANSRVLFHSTNTTESSIPIFCCDCKS